MKISEKDLELLDGYITQSLSASDMHSVKERLAKEPELARDYNELRLIVESLRVSTLNNKLKMLQELEEGKKPVQVEKPLKSKSWFLVLTGAVIVLVLFVVYYWKNETKSDLTSTEDLLIADNISDDFVLHKTMRSSNDSSELSLEQRKAYDLYAIQEFKDAIPLLEELWQANQDTLAYFYLGVSYVATGQHEKAQKY
ncbi:MAG: hypothetical protein IPM42_07385 [Saprospiraceae bacterium]|nr:hypothetical protein [Saprospiraceae bacterium]